MDKVVLPKEVADAIEGLVRLGKDNRWILGAASGLTEGKYSNKIEAFADKEYGNISINLYQR